MAMSRICAAFVGIVSVGAVASSARGQDLIGELAKGSLDGLFGGACTGIGDVDGDGVPDILVGAMYAEFTNGKTGRAFVFTGATLGLILTLDGTNVGDLFGYRVLALPDVDGDAVGDFIVAAPHADTAGGTRAGRVSVYSGGSGLLIRDHDGGSSSQDLGYSLAAIHDLDADGVGDYLVGAPQGQGEVYAYSGATGSLLFTLSKGPGGQSFGFTLATIGDVDADGVDDFAVGTWSGGNGRGVVDVFSGATQANLTTIVGVPPDDAGIGKSLAGGGDFDGDGVPDLVVGDPSHLTNGTDSGAVIVYSGATWAPLVTWYGRNAMDQFGVSVSCIGDANADGVPDVLIGSSIGYKRRGNAFLYSGRSGQRLFRFVADGPATKFGQSIGAAGDLTGDGLADLLVGATDDSKAGHHTGRVFVYSGNDLFLDSNGSAFNPGDVAVFDWHCTSATQLSALVVVDIASVPCFTIIDLGATDALGERSFSATVPSGLTGIDVSLQAFAIDPNRGSIDSAVKTISFL